MSDVSTDDQPTEPSAVRARPHHKRRVVLVTLASVLSVVLVAGVAFGVYAYRHLGANIATIEDPQEQADRPTAVVQPVEESKAPLNILLIGSDSRSGDNGFVGGIADAGRSDTTMLLHVSADRSRALAVSIPRDSMVDMPACKTTTGGTSSAGLRMFNEAYSLGGASCVRRTVEQLTDIRIDHFVVVDFAGFRDMVGALGGVKVYLPEAVNDAQHGITLPAGCVTLDGEQSLKYVRVRYIGGGSDPERLARQQAFLSSVIQKVTSKGTLTNPVKLYSFLDAATRSLATDRPLNSVSALASLAQDLRSVGLDRIQLMTIPYEAYVPDPNRLQWASAAEDVWTAIREDEPLPGRPSGATNGSVSGRPLTAAPSTINVRVVNGSGSPKAAKAAAAGLTRLGYTVVESTTAPATSDSIVRWSAPRNQSSRTLAAATGLPRQQVDGLGQVIELVVGADYAGVSSVKLSDSSGSSGSAGKPSPKPTFDTRTASTSICR